MKDNIPRLDKTHPEISAQWHPILNGNFNPSDFTHGSEYKAWWKCNKAEDHEWESFIYSRTGNRKNNCPCCAGQKIVKLNCLLTTHSELCKEWHPILNKNITPKDISYGSNKKVWWKCNKVEDHIWLSSIAHRIEGKGCPCCSGKKVVLSNCLQTKYPEIVKQWDFTKNDSLTPLDVTTGSNKKVWWKCAKNHSWQAMINKKEKRGCPYCANQKVCLSNCLAIINPKLAKQWHPTKNGDLTPFDISGHHSNRKIWWICDKEKDHEWIASPTNRIKTGCPYCRNLKVSLSNCLATTHKELCKEWHKDNNITTYDVTKGSGKFVLWECKKGHNWKAAIRTRTRKNGSGCPICRESHGNRGIADILTNLKIDFKKEYRIQECKNERMLPFDFAIFSNIKLIGVIEYQGGQHYKPIKHWGGEKQFNKTKKNDDIKENWCKRNNLPLLIIPFTDFDNMEENIKSFHFKIIGV